MSLKYAIPALLICATLHAQDYGSGWWRGRAVNYKVVDGFGVAEGDIVLGPVDELQNPVAEPGKSPRREAVARTAARFLWPDGIIPYVIDPDLPNQQRVADAVDHWNTNTPIRLVQRTNQTNYVKFVKKPDICSSAIGMVGREQMISLADDCTSGNVIHEIGHAVGLFHEQSRNDRDFWVRMLPENVDKRELSNFDQALSSGQDMGGYDFSSIMHYEVTAFSRNGKPVLQTTPAGIPISQRDVLSPGDLDAVRRLYEEPIEATTISSFPFGLNVMVDGETFQAPKTFQWAPGSQHTVSVPDPQMNGAYRYLFGRWSDDGDQTHTITASRDLTIFTASFIQQVRMPLTVAQPDGGRLEITPASPDGWFADGTEVEVRAIPNDGWNFAAWSGFGLFGVHGVSPNPLKVIAHGPDTRYAANFTRGAVTLITSDPPGLKVQVDGKAVVTPEGFRWTAGSTHTLTVEDPTQDSGNDTARHEWTGWSNNGDQSQTITAAAESSTITARFKTQYNVFVEGSSGGSVELTPRDDMDFYDAGSTLTLRPNPVSGGRFLGWSGDVIGSDDPGSITVDDQKLVSASFGTPRQIAGSGIVNAASYGFAGGVAPGTVMTIFGVDIGPDPIQTLAVSGGRVTTDLGGYHVTFDDIPAPLVYVAKNQVSAVVPYEVAGRDQVLVRVAGPGWTSAARALPVIATNPGLFTANSSGRGPAAALNQDGSVNTADNPAAKGSVLMLYGTGGGASVPAPANGQVVSVDALPRPVLPVRVRIAGRNAGVQYAGGAPGMLAGVMQINAQIPGDCPSGAVPVVVGIGDGASAPGVTIWVR
jgi:astacin